MFFLCLALSPALAYKGTLPTSGSGDSGVDLRLNLLYAESPDFGDFLPVHVTMRNVSPEKRQGVFEAKERAGTAHAAACWTISVDPGAAIETDIFLPSLQPRYGWPELEARVVGFEGNRVIMSNYGNRGGANPRTHFAALSDSLAGSRWSEIEKTLNDGLISGPDKSEFLRKSAGTSYNRGGKIGPQLNKRSLQGSALDLNELPADARALSGVVGLWVTAAEWRGLTAPRREAIGQWMEEGGSLFVATDVLPKSPLPELPRTERFDEVTRRGFGSFRLVQSTGGQLSPEAAANAILGLDGEVFPLRVGDFGGSPLLSEVGEPELNAKLSLAIMGLFAALAGPVNLYWLAPARRRHRLFYTAPLISLGGALALAACVFQIDGVGGWGKRNVLAFISSGHHRFSLVQEQVSQTRLLLHTDFVLPPGVSIQKLPIVFEPGELALSDGVASGDWFMNRRRQAHLLRATLPSRAGVTVRPDVDGTPLALSTAPSLLRDVYHVDRAGELWHGAVLAPGRPLRLEKSSAADFQAWARTATGRFSEGLKMAWRAVEGRPGYFYAMADSIPGVPIETLPSIRWGDDVVLYCGPCEEEASP